MSFVIFFPVLEKVESLLPTLSSHLPLSNEESVWIFICRKTIWCPCGFLQCIAGLQELFVVHSRNFSLEGLSRSHMLSQQGPWWDGGKAKRLVCWFSVEVPPLPVQTGCKVMNWWKSGWTGSAGPAEIILQGSRPEKARLPAKRHALNSRVEGNWFNFVDGYILWGKFNSNSERYKFGW